MNTVEVDLLDSSVSLVESLIEVSTHSSYTKDTAAVCDELAVLESCTCVVDNSTFNLTLLIKTGDLDALRT